MRGRYTTEELTELDAFGAKIGIELVPCIQTLAHLNQIFRWEEYAAINDNNDILLIDDERTYALIEKMIATMRKAFRSHKIHIGMDERIWWDEVGTRIFTARRLPVSNLS
ncbi:MAG: family 20 glycosylhydrolase [Christensenellales bacterium]